MLQTIQTAQTKEMKIWSSHTRERPSKQRATRNQRVPSLETTAVLSGSERGRRMLEIGPDTRCTATPAETMRAWAREQQKPGDERQAEASISIILLHS